MCLPLPPPSNAAHAQVPLWKILIPEDDDDDMELDDGRPREKDEKDDGIPRKIALKVRGPRRSDWGLGAVAPRPAGRTPTEPE